MTIKVVPIQNEQFTTKIPLGAAVETARPTSSSSGAAASSSTRSRPARSRTSRKYVEPGSSRIGGSAAGLAGQRQAVRRPVQPRRRRLLVQQGALRAGRHHRAADDLAELIADDRQAEGGGHRADRDRRQGQWPDAFYWDYFAVQALQQAGDAEVGRRPTTSATRAGSRPARTRSSSSTPSRSRTASSARRPSRARQLGRPASANGKAAMELQGHWNPGVMQSLTADKKIPSYLGWFPFPSVPGGKALPGSLLGGGDGFACSVEGAAARVRRVPRVHRQPERAEAARLDELRPAGAKGTESSRQGPEPAQAVLKYRSKSPFIQLYFDIALLAGDRAGARRRDRRPVRRQGEPAAGRRQQIADVGQEEVGGDHRRH